ncbi:MAG TPA: hypothetical protein VMU08_07400 [Rhizomicrobium sp.]|nr:hypothetical protein [Rhizomicrobium sp.]
MRQIVALLFGTILLAACTKATPPQGRWEGAYDAGQVFVAARVEIASAGQVRISAPDVTDAGVASEDDRIQMRENVSARLAGGWGDVAPRPMDFDGTTFRKPGGIAPQMDYDPATRRLTLYVYLGTRPPLLIPLRPVSQFSDNPWTR